MRFRFRRHTYSLIASNIKKLDYYDRTAKRGVVYYYKVTCSDTCGNTSGYSKTVFANALADTIKPVINSINPPAGTYVGEAYNKISVLASDNNLLDDVVIEYRIGSDGDYVLLKKEENIALQSIRYKECVDCMTELESEIIPKLDHTDEDGDNICDVCGEQIPVTVSCSHICHKKGFAGFIWRIIRIIFKIFGSNKYCECGAEHY